MKKFYLFIFSTFFVFSLTGQVIVPLHGNPVLQDLNEDRLKPNSIIELRNDECDIEQAGITYLASGERLVMPIGIDTVGLDTNQMAGIYTCIQCNNSPFGNASLKGDTLIYQANPNIQSGLHEFSVQYEDEQGTRTGFFSFIIRRAGTAVFLPEIPINPEESTRVEADISGLSGNLVCSFLLNCSESYDGRDQEIVFSRPGVPDNIFTYTASRFGGVDSVCLVLCNEVATCDTFNYAFRIRQESIDSLPIFDDFSYAGPFPDSTIWLEDDPYVNRQIAIDPPSIGVATFDGLNRRGIPYGGGYGMADRLTSKTIKMEQYQGDVITLSYWLQRKGLGNKPELEDSMAVEIKNRFGEWELLRSIPGIPFNVPNSVIDTFAFYMDTIPELFKHNDFQFRFVSYSDRTGILDNWHLDYVRLEEDGRRTFNDVAFIAEPGFILKQYSSMPYSHFIGTDTSARFLIDSIRVKAQNHSLEDNPTFPSILDIIEVDSRFNLLQNDNLVLLNNVESDIPANSVIEFGYNLNTVTRFANFFPNVNDNLANPQNFGAVDKVNVSMSYAFTPDKQERASVLEAVFRNDFVATTTVLDNYFAYDDGTAEAGFIAQQNNSIAQKFTSFIDDSLRAVQFHFPVTTADVSNQVFDLRVYVDDLNSEPVYEAFSLPVVFASSFYDTLQGFTTYPLVDQDGNNTPVYLPQGSDFFVSWTQISQCEGFQCIPVGFDLNSNRGRDEIYADLTGVWEPLDSALIAVIPEGSLMLRAVVGSETPFATSVEDLDKVGSEIGIYPNPSSGMVNIDLEEGNYSTFNYQLYNAMGQVLFQGTLSSLLDFSGTPNGVYTLKVRDTNTLAEYSKRLIIK